MQEQKIPIAGFVDNWIAFYSGPGAAAHLGLTVAQAAYGATFGDAIGVALLIGKSGNHIQLGAAEVYRGPGCKRADRQCGRDLQGGSAAWGRAAAYTLAR